jgi:L-2-hydroxyglutarate oxidase LhgO
MLALQSPVERIVARPAGGFEVHVGGTEPMAVRARQVVNAAGLHAQALARCIRRPGPGAPCRRSNGRAATTSRCRAGRPSAA